MEFDHKQINIEMKAVHTTDAVRGHTQFHIVS